MSAQAALAEIQRFQKIFSVFKDAEQAINELASIDQSLVEKTAALNTITDQYNAQILANEELLSVTNTLKQTYDNKIIEGEARVDSEVALYRETELARATQEVQDTIKALSDTSAQLQADIVRMQGQQSQLQQAITDKTAVLDDLSNKISSAQATIQTLLGA